MGDRTALIVEDNATILKLLTRNLTSRGYDVTPVNYFETKTVPESRFDLAIVDGLDGDGISVLNKIDAENKFLYTGSIAMKTVAENQGIISYYKSINLGEILKEMK